MYKREKRSLQDGTIPQRRKTPSFSSSLLDSIYRSIDESTPQQHRYSGFYADSDTMIKKQSLRTGASPQKKLSSLQRAIMIEEWMEKQNHPLHFNFDLKSASSSSESSSGATFSSSSDAEQKKIKLESDVTGGGFTKTTKLRALKIYGELKRVKQPISPGGRISTFLNSIFNSGSVKKAKMCYVGAVDDISFDRKSSKSSAAARSCMTKTDHSSKSKTNRSVRFYPVSVIVGEDSRPCGHKPVYYNGEVRKNPSMSSSSSAKNRAFNKKRFCDEDFEDDDEDRESCASSDLFELDHLIGIGRYREELPVYETTSLKKNHAIASGLQL